MDHVTLAHGSDLMEKSVVIAPHWCKCETMVDPATISVRPRTWVVRMPGMIHPMERAVMILAPLDAAMYSRGLPTAFANVQVQVPVMMIAVGVTTVVMNHVTLAHGSDLMEKSVVIAPHWCKCETMVDPATISVRSRTWVVRMPGMIHPMERAVMILAPLDAAMYSRGLPTAFAN